MSLCKNCEKRPGTQKYVGDGGILAYVHGMYEMWCPICVTLAQLKYAEDAAARVVELRTKLEILQLCDELGCKFLAGLDGRCFRCGRKEDEL